MEPNSAQPHDLIVIGASAGGVETLRRVVGGLPVDLQAAVCVVLHLSPGSPSALANILQRAGALPCRAAVDGEMLRLGEILVAPPDRHLVIEDGRVRLSVGPRENGHRPAVDVLFRSAATARAGRVIGVILSGTRDDGSVGLARIKAQGGLAVVQDPKEAMYAGMPASALASVAADAVVTSDMVADTLVALVNGTDSPPDDPRTGREPDPPGGPKASLPPSVGGEGTSPSSANRPVITICPECGGVLSERREVGAAQWECRVGHRYSPESLLEAQATDVEAAMWAAVRALQDRRILLERIAAQFEARGQTELATAMRGRASDANHHARAVREVLDWAATSSLREFAPSAVTDDASDLLGTEFEESR